MRRLSAIAVAVLLALPAAPASTAAKASAACRTYEADVFDRDNMGYHEPELGALAFAGLVGVTDARFAVCGWPRVDWEPLRSQILALAPRVFAKAGVPGEKIESQMRLMRTDTLTSAAKFSKEAQCIAPAGTMPIEQRVLRSERHVLEWGETYLKC